MKTKRKQVILYTIFLASIILLAPLVESQQPVDVARGDLTPEEKSLLSSTDVLAINGTVFQDLNGNAARDNGEPGLFGWIVKLLRDGSEVSNAKTDRFGCYAFTDFEQGVYAVAEELQAGWNQTGNGTYQINLTDKSISNIDFGNKKSDVQQRDLLQGGSSGNFEAFGTSMQDAFGYVLKDSNEPDGPTYNWIEVSDGTQILPGSDDSDVTIPLDFAFNFYGTDYSNLRISNNGWLSFGERLSFSNNPILSYPVHGFMAPFWDDIVTWNGGSVYYKTIGTEPNRMFVVEWKDNGHCCNMPVTERITFEAILCEGSNNILFQYQDTTFGGPYYALCDLGASASVGIDSPDGINGLQYSYNSPVIQPNLAILFTCPNQPSNNPPDTPTVPSGQTSGITGTSYDYTTSARDPDGDQVQITVDWGDGSTSTSDPVASEATATLSHAWIAAGTYQVKAMATDCNGATSSWSESLTVTINTPPDTPTVPTGPVSGFAWVPYSYQTSARDQDADQVRITIDWGDGTTSTSDPVNSETAVSLTHTWTAAGTYLIKAMATDSKSATSAWSATLTVNIAPNRRPNAPFRLTGPTFGYVGVSYPFLTSGTDPDGNKVKYVYDWGDGTTYTTPLVNSGTTASISHKWTAAGTYQVRTMVTDSKGAPSAWSIILTVRIVDRPQAGMVRGGQ